MPTYYDILGVSEHATQDEIHEAYQRRRENIHPENSDNPNADQEFMRIKEAYDILSDPDQRTKYDKLGHDAFLNSVSGGREQIEATEDSFDVTAHTRQSQEASYIWDDEEVRTADILPPVHTADAPFWKRLVGYGSIVVTMVVGTMIIVFNALQYLPTGEPTPGGSVPLWAGLVFLGIGFGLVAAAEHLLDTHRRMSEV